MRETLHKRSPLRYYFPGVLGFVISFVTVISLFAFYQAQRDYSAHAAIELSNSVATPSAVAMISAPEEVRTVPAPPRLTETPSATAPSDTQTSEKVGGQADKGDEPVSQKTPVYKFHLGKIVRMEATAYCLNSVTASGVKSKYGIVAADPQLLPIGSIVRLYADEYSGLYTVLDTGGKIKGRKIDIYLTDYKEACQFGRRKVHLEVLRYGWNPQASSLPF